MCVKIESLSLFIPIFHLIISPTGPTSLGESNNPITTYFLGTNATTYKGGLTSMTLHDSNTMITLSIGGMNSFVGGTIIKYKYNIKYTSEYLQKLQLH